MDWKKGKKNEGYDIILDSLYMNDGNTIITAGEDPFIRIWMVKEKPLKYISS